MIHRLALLMGGTGAAGVLALALALGGFGGPLPNTADAFVPVANNALGGGLLPAEAPTDQPTMATSLGGGEPQATHKKVVDTVYVRPAPTRSVVHRGKPANDANQPAEPTGAPRDNSSAGQDDQSNTGDHSEDGGSGDGGHEPGGD